MSVIVKGMRMPKNCGECPLRDGLYCVASDYKRISYEGLGKVEDWCHIVDLGKHGDLIDRDELRAKFPEPKDMIDPQQALVHITGVWAEIDCADAVIEAEDET